MKKVVFELVGVLVTVILLIAFDVFLYFMAYRTGYGEALGEVKDIMEDQIKSDTTVSKVVIINPDTNVFILSPKYPISKK